MKFKSLSLLSSTLIISTALTGCFGKSKDDKIACTNEAPNMAIQTSLYPDSSAVALGCSVDAEATDGLLKQEKSDYNISAGNDSLYHIGKFTIDTVEKFEFNSNINGGLESWKFSTNDKNNDDSSNPYKVVEVNKNKAYIIRFGKEEVFIINPSKVPTDEGFLLGTIDLGKYNVGGRTNTTMADALLIDDKLYIGMSQLTASWGYENPSKVAVIDIKTDKESAQAITLKGNNLITMVQDGDSIYVANRGNGGYSGVNFGTLEKINTNDNSVEMILNANNDALQKEDNPLGHIVDVTVHDDAAYLLTYTAWQSARLHSIDVENKSIIKNLDFLKGKNISGIEKGPEDYLWVLSGDTAKPGVYKLNPKDASIAKKSNGEDAFIPTLLPAINIVFKQ